ncbi:unnamed protein product [Sphagnum jensenii]|uniref:Uncharacterized protein n=1 Tax=Sphagnum jensenii TaxID=128206 RepID=A0ABP1AIV1_9BRYO
MTNEYFLETQCLQDCVSQQKFELLCSEHRVIACDSQSVEMTLATATSSFLLSLPALVCHGQSIDSNTHTAEYLSTRKNPKGGGSDEDLKNDSLST